MRSVALSLVALLCWAAPLRSQTDTLAVSTAPAEAAADTARLRLELPLLDAPYNLAHGVRAPSMRQALAVTEGFYELSHRGSQEVRGDHRILAKVSIALSSRLGSFVEVEGKTAGWVAGNVHLDRSLNLRVGRVVDGAVRAPLGRESIGK